MKFDPSIVQIRHQSPLGLMMLAATHSGLAGVWFEGQQHMPNALTSPPGWPLDTNHPVLIKTKQQLSEYFAGQMHFQPVMWRYTKYWVCKALKTLRGWRKQHPLAGNRGAVMR